MLRKEYFEIVENRRRQDALELQKKYKLIGPLITKVEGLVFNTNTSQSLKMKVYYAYWERQVFSTLSEVSDASSPTTARLIVVSLLVGDRKSQISAQHAGARH